MHPSLLLLVVLQGAPIVQPTRTECPDVLRIELSQTDGALPEVCVGPGLLTGFVVDSRVVVDLEAELRFAEVTRGNTSVMVMPPGDAQDGERFRLMVHFPDGASASFMLVVHRGRATRQVEVFRDQRTRESFLHEVAQEQARNQQLQQENESLRQQLEQLRAECGDPRGMRRLLASGSMGKAGIPARKLTPPADGHTEGPLSVVRGSTYRSENRIAISVWLANAGTEPWSASMATLVDAKGQELTGIRLWLDGGTILPHESRMLVVEADAEHGVPRGDVTLMLREDGPRSITIPGVALPR